MERAGEAIASAGGAVIVAFLALILSSLSIFRAIGPALAIAVAVTLLAVLTLVPGRDHAARPEAVLAVEEVAAGARGTHASSGSAIPSAAGLVPSPRSPA